MRNPSRSGRGWWLVCLLLSACGRQLPGNVTPAERAAPAAPEADCDKTSWIAGTTELCKGRLIYRDYVYDDYGAGGGVPATAPPGGGSLVSSAGNARYPVGAENTADLVRFELHLAGKEVEVEFELNTLYERGQILAALALDADNNPATGSVQLLGLRVAGADEVHEFREGDPASNLIRGRFTRPAGTRWKLWAVLAQADGTVMNLAFRGPDERATTGSFWEDQQAAALAQADISTFAASVDVDELERGVTRAAVVGPGLHQRVYTSAYTLPPGEGISVDGVPGRHGRTDSGCEQYFNYLGRYQPYGIYLPATPGPHSLVVNLHGCGDNHASQISGAGFQRQFGEELNRIIVSPLGRGSVGWFSDISERDVLDVMDDVLAQHPVDAEQVTISGYSMGGYGALRLGAYYPDRFAAVVSWVGNTGHLFNTPLPGNPLPGFEELASGASGAQENVIDLVGNLLHVPVVGLYSGGDYLVPVSTALTLLQQLMNAAGGVYDFYLHPAAEHLTYAVLDSWRKEAEFTAGRERVRSPSRVVYRIDPALDFPEYAIRHDAAYWISGIVARDAGYADVDVTSLACGLPQPQYESGQDSGVGPLVLAWLRSYRRAAAALPLAARNRLEGRLANVAALDIDARAACLGPGLDYRIETDGPVQLDLGDGRRLQIEAAGLHEGVLP